eukprot:TRINITY_DN8129_c1_g1_i3.p1 TRINITY_DN8129_c1_g1~~TRINITY_DN8129_c1_g1_i3.p1  ORF type:complete len:679 (-),score=260.87 TRINITY_DN8129_c1_g1_i3:410-2446(-)
MQRWSVFSIENRIATGRPRDDGRRVGSETGSVQRGRDRGRHAGLRKPIRNAYRTDVHTRTHIVVRCFQPRIGSQLNGREMTAIVSTRSTPTQCSARVCGVRVRVCGVGTGVCVCVCSDETSQPAAAALPGGVQHQPPPAPPPSAASSAAPSPVLLSSHSQAAPPNAATAHRQLRQFEIPDQYRERLPAAACSFLMAFSQHTQQFGALLALFDFERAMRLSLEFWQSVPPEQRLTLDTSDVIACVQRRDDEAYQVYLALLMPSVLESRALEFANAIQYFAKIYKGQLSHNMTEAPELLRVRRVAAAYNWSVQLYQRATISETAYNVRTVLAVPGRIAQLGHDWGMLQLEPLLDLSQGRLMCNRVFISAEVAKVKEMIDRDQFSIESLADQCVRCLGAVIAHSQRSHQSAEAVTITDNFMTHWQFFADLIVRELSLTRSHEVAGVLKSAMEQYLNFIIQQYLRETAAARPVELDVAPIAPVPVPLVFSSSTSTFPAGSPHFLPPSYQTSFSSFSVVTPQPPSPTAAAAVAPAPAIVQQQQQQYHAMYPSQPLQSPLQLLQQLQQQQQQQLEQQLQQELGLHQLNQQPQPLLQYSLASSLPMQYRQPDPPHPPHELLQLSLADYQSSTTTLGVLPAGSAPSEPSMLFGAPSRDLRDSGPRAPSAPKKLRPQQFSESEDFCG